MTLNANRRNEMPRKKGVETWRRILTNAEKIPDIFVDGKGSLYIKGQGGKIVPLDISILATTLSLVKEDLMKLGLALKSKGKKAKKEEGNHAEG
jgi:hypothetical protein